MYKFFIIVLIVIVLIYKFNQLLTSSFREHNIPIKTLTLLLSNTSKRYLNNLSHNKSSYKILLWTKYFGSDDWLNLNLKEMNCEYSNCILTSNRDELDISDSILFHWRDVRDDDMPEYHLIDQKWVLYNWEPPSNSPIDKLYPFGDHINWTMSYRHDSDIFVPYGKILKCNKNFIKIKYKFHLKNKSIAWIVSNCDTESKRELYVKELQKYIDVHVFGKCGQFQCNFDTQCYHMIAKNYKFYLSFENSVSFLLSFFFNYSCLILNFFFSYSIALQRLCDRKVIQNYWLSYNTCE
jgi:hypothetical protein